MGKVPAIVHKGKVVTEVAAICCYLADAFPEAGLAPPPAERADYYRWIFFTAGPVEAAFSNKSAGWEPTPEQQRMFGYGNYDLAIDTLEKALRGQDIYRRRPFHRRRPVRRRDVNFMLAVQPARADGRCSSIMRARMTDRDAYRRAKEIDGKLIAEMQATAATAATAAGDASRRADDEDSASRRSRSTTASRMKAWTAATSWRGWPRSPASAAAAELLIASIAASPAAAAIVPPDDNAPDHAHARPSPGGYKAYVAEPRTRSLKTTVLVIHENRGLNDHIRDVARRLRCRGLPRRRARHALALRRHARQ